MSGFYTGYIGMGVGRRLLLADDFERANSTTTPGSTNGNGLYDPEPWQETRGQWGILDGELYCFDILGSPLVSACTMDIGVVNFDLTVEFAALSSSVNAGTMVMIRYFNNTNYIGYLADELDRTVLRKTESNINTDLTTRHSGAAAGDIMRIVNVGDDIWTYRNGVLLDGPITTTFQSSLSRFGFYAGHTSNGTSPSRFDNFTMYSA